ncbi:MAG: cytochrome c biogenesis protein CcsA [Coriobacteriia bacterium]|nr:cytochrome c biogenesis protein CcsA [Coriobacteriia bacterium]
MGLSDLGNILLALASICALASIGLIAFGTWTKDGEGLIKAGHYMTYGVLAFTSMAIVLLAAAFLGENFSLEYVAFNHPTIVGPWAWLYRLSGVWAGREGSLLFWEWVLAIYAAFVARKFIDKNDRLGSVALAVINFVQLFFLAALFIKLNNPFQALDPSYLDASGRLLIDAAMNALLQNPWMLTHPPALFVGYAGLTVPFAFALAALITGDTSSHWVKISDRITVFSWLLLGIGIGLGSIWAYVELAFGGYWAWDPVENASLLPWLTGVALIHSMTVYRRREGFRTWTIFLAGLTFVLVLLGTFITRSGVVASVHAFQVDMRSFWLFIVMMAGSMAAIAAGIAYRRKELGGSETFDRLISKEGSYYFNNLIMTIAALLVAYLTISSAFKDWPLAWLTSWWPAAGKSFGAATYDTLARPIGIFYIFVMSVCPILAWGGGEPGSFLKRAKWPLAGAAVLGAGLLGLWWFDMVPYFQQTSDRMSAGATNVIAIVGLLTAAFAIALPLYLFIDGARKRAAAKGESFGSALWWVLSKPRTQSGGYLTHLGLGVILVGLIGSTMYVQTFNTSLAQTPGAQLQAGGYAFAYQSLEETTEGNGDVVYTATLDVLRDGTVIDSITPRLVFPVQLQSQNQSTQKVDITMSPVKDIFVSFAGLDQAGNLALTVKYFPMQIWVWTGFMLTIIGTALASWPKRRARAAA